MLNTSGGKGLGIHYRRRERGRTVAYKKRGRIHHGHILPTKTISNFRELLLSIFKLPY